MAKIKNARSGEYMISQNAEGAIKVAKDYENDKAALREVSEKLGFEVTPSWTTRQLGRKLIEAINGDAAKTQEYSYAESGEYVIFQTEETQSRFIVTTTTSRALCAKSARRLALNTTPLGPHVN